MFQPDLADNTLSRSASLCGRPTVRRELPLRAIAPIPDIVVERPLFAHRKQAIGFWPLDAQPFVHRPATLCRVFHDKGYSRATGARECFIPIG
jgi:hypothetical protein